VINIPFININITVATKLLDDNETLELLLKDGQINPKEFEILNILRKYAQVSDDNSEKGEYKTQLEILCKKHFEKEAQRSFDLLLKFANKRANVSWVLFSRSNQFIHYTEENPLEGYMPRKNEIIKTVTRVKLAKI